MTDNQRIAIDELAQYKEAQKDIMQIKQRVEAMETRIQRSTRACDSLMQQTFVDGHYISVPMAIQTSGRNAAEELIDSLMEMRITLMRKQADAERLCMKIEQTITERCSGVDARFLRYYFLYGQRLEQIAVIEKYSFANVKKIKWRALERYGSKSLKE